MKKLQLNLARTVLELGFLFRTRKHPEVAKMLSGKPPESLTDHLHYVATVQNKSRWIFIAYSEIEMVGYSQVYGVNEENIEIGFVIHPDFQGKSFGKSLVLETISKATEKFPNKKVILYVLRNNAKAIHIYKKLGFIEKDLPQSDKSTLGMELSE